MSVFVVILQCWLYSRHLVAVGLVCAYLFMMISCLIIVGSKLVTKAVEEMIREGCNEVMLEAEVSNIGSLQLYENLGFLRDKRLCHYYLNGADAFRLILPLDRKEDDSGKDSGIENAEEATL